MTVGPCFRPPARSRSACRASGSCDAAGEADLLLNLSGKLSDADVLDRVPVRAYVDLDPVFAQLWQAAEGVDMGFDAHTAFVSVADSIGQAGLPDPELRP